MRPGLFCVCLLIVAALYFPAAVAQAASDAMTIDARLIWGTNDAKTDSKLKPVGPRLSDKLKHSPFKWDHYYECTTQKPFTLKLNQGTRVTMSKHCEIAVTNLGDSQIKLELYGNGQLVNTVTQALPKGEFLIVGGESENSTAWFVVVRQAD
jgi:hypothetical protein